MKRLLTRVVSGEGKGPRRGKEKSRERDKKLVSKDLGKPKDRKGYCKREMKRLDKFGLQKK